MTKKKSSLGSVETLAPQSNESEQKQAVANAYRNILTLLKGGSFQGQFAQYVQAGIAFLEQMVAQLEAPTLESTETK